MLYRLHPDNPDAPFPPVELALPDPPGLLAVGGDLSPARLVNAYRRGIFPWFSHGEPILWWSPDPRMVFWPDGFHISRSLAKTLRSGRFRVTFDQAFPRIIQACAGPREKESGTWITAEMMTAYCRLHELNIAHSVEVWDNDELAGGLYGIALGRVFFGESMFSARRDASKVALAELTRRLRAWNYLLIDCQVVSEHLVSLGAVTLPRREFSRLLKIACNEPADGPWKRTGLDHD